MNYLVIPVLYAHEKLHTLVLGQCHNKSAEQKSCCSTNIFNIYCYKERITFD